MRTLGFVTLAFVVAFVAGFAAAVFGAYAYMDTADVFDRDGGLAMAVFFTLGPLGGVVAGAIAATVTGLRMRRTRSQVAAGSRPPSQRWPIGRRAIFTAFVWAVAVYAVIQLAYWLWLPASFETYESALVASWLPIALPLLAGALAVGFVFWRRAPDTI